MENEIQYPIVAQPKRVKVSLYKHQLTSIYNMEILERNKMIIINNLEEIRTRVGILSDLTGYGKTLSILGLIDRDKMNIIQDEPFIVKTYEGNNLIHQKKVFLYENINSNLIVLNSSLLNQWEDEVKKTDFKYYVINTKKNVDEVQPQNYDLVLCNQTMYGYLVSRFRKFSWKRLIIDEPQTFKLGDYNNFAFNFMWLITATPYELMNNKKVNHIFKELFNENELLFTKVIIRNPDEYVKASFRMPENIHFQYQSYNPMSKVLNGIVSPVLMEMIVAGNIREAIKFLGGNIETPESLYYLVKNKKLAKLKEIEIQILSKEKNIEKLIERKNTIEEQILQLENRLKDVLEENCIICNETLKKPLFLTCCQNIMCGECILKWMTKKNSCPLCRSDIKKEDLILINDPKNEDIEEKKTKVLLTKPQIIFDIVDSRKEGKFIIFSNYDESFITIKKLFDEANVSYGEIKGNKDIRSKNIANYKSGTLQVLFLNSKNNASGINLEETTDIILYHQMTDFCETQILGRANRIGRTTTLNVHHIN